MQELYSQPVQEELIRARIAEIKQAGGLAAVSATPAAALKFGKAVAEAGADLFFVQATVVSTDHLGPEGQETLDLENLCRSLGVPVVIGNCVTYEVALLLMRAGAAAVSAACSASSAASPAASAAMLAAAAANDAAFAFKTGFSARALIGLLGNDNFSFKVSPDGSAYIDAIRIDRTSGQEELQEYLDANCGVAP